MSAGPQSTSADASPVSGVRRAGALGLCLAIVLAWLTAAGRMHVALADPEFDVRDPSGMLKSDPALLYALLDRIVDAGGRIPADFAHDTRLEHPDEIDVATRFPLAPLVVIAWVQRAFGGDTALHVTASWVSAVSMGLALVGVYLLARELSRSVRLALLACLLTAATPAFHRSIGFVLVDEDFFWPLFALHLGLVARAVRTRSAGGIVLAAIPAAAALATWHAAAFFLALEACVALGWLAFTGASPLAVSGPDAERARRATYAGAAIPLSLAAVALATPFLREVRAVFSIPVAAAIGLWCAALAPRFARGIGIGVTAVVALIGVATAGGAYGHVYALLAAKLQHFGLRPPTAAGLAGDVRILWQGPFETPSWPELVHVLAIGGALGVVATVAAFTRKPRAQHGPVVACAALFVLALGAAWLARRGLVLPALLAGPLAAWAATRVRFGAAIFGAAVLIQCALAANWAAHYRNPWYHLPVQRQDEIRWMVETVARTVPRDEAIAADFMSSTAILAHSGNPICFSPKWEAAEPRRRAIEFLDLFHHATPAEFRARMIERYAARWLVVDRLTLQYLAHWSANLPADSFEPLAGTAAAALLSQDETVLRSIPGYELIARSPSTIRRANGAPTDFYRIYKLTD